MIFSRKLTETTLLQLSWAPYAVFTLCILATYSNVYHNAFLFDDTLLISLNEYLRSWKTVTKLLSSSTLGGVHVEGGFYRPLQMALYFMLYQGFGPNSIAYHALNILIHIGNASLAYKLGCRLRFHRGATFLATLLWALHPIHTEAITYMSATGDQLFAFFCLLSIFILFPTFSTKRFYLSTFLMFWGLMAKETTVVLPILAVITLYAVHPKRLSLKTYFRTWPLWCVMLAYTTWRMTTPGLDGPQSYDRFYQQPDFYNLRMYSENIDDRIYTFLATLPSYAKLLLFPTDLHMERDFPVFTEFWCWPVVIGALLLLSALFYILKNWKTPTPLSWGLLWFAGAHLPDTGLLIPMNSLFLEHWMYLPSLGLFLGATENLTLILAKKHLNARWLRNTILACFVSVIALASFLTYNQNEVWRDPITFYTHIFKYGEISARGHNNLAIAYMDEGDIDHAILEFHQAIMISDTYAETRHNLAIALSKLPNQRAHIPEVIANLKRAIEIDPKFYRSYEALSQVYKFLEDDTNASFYLMKTRELKENLSSP